MRRYMHAYGYQHNDFAGFAINSHHNASTNPFAMYPHEITLRLAFQARDAAASLFTAVERLQPAALWRIGDGRD